MFSSFTAGAFLLTAGLIGFDVRYMRGWFRGGRWVEPPVWWQLAAGVVLLWVAVYTYRGLRSGWVRAAPAPLRMPTKSAGRGRSAGAEQPHGGDGRALSDDR